MDHLIELVQFLSKNKFKHLEVFAKNSRLWVFYEKLRDGSLKTEQEARDFFFPNNKNAKSYYYRLAQQLEERLLNLLFLIDFNQTATNEVQKNALVCYRNYAAAQSLMARFMRTSAIKVAEETIKISLKYEFTDVTLPLARTLALHYGLMNPKKQKFRQYSELAEQMQELMNAEILAEKYYAEMYQHYGFGRSSDLVFAKKFIAYSDELKIYTQRLSSYRLNLLSHEVFIATHQFMTDYTKTAEACREALHFFKQQQQRDSRVVIINFTSRLMAALHMLGHHQAVIEEGQKIMPIIPDHNVNWFNTSEALICAYLHSKQYELALDALVKVKNNPALSKQPSILQERWRTVEAMIYYLIRTGRLQKPEGVEFNFRTKKFINEFTTSLQDKSGNNIVLITLMILFLLLDEDYNSIIDKIDSLKIYAHRHLRRDETYRSNCFIKMVLQLEKGNFHPVAVQRKAEPYYKKLLAVPLHKAKQDYGLEIIPFETLWSFILESL